MDELILSRLLAAPVTVSFAVVATVFSVLAQYFVPGLYERFALQPRLFFQEGRFFTVFTCSFLHGDMLFLAVNVAMLLYSGLLLEPFIGSVAMFVVVFFSLVVPNLLVLFRYSKLFYFHLGASGVIMGAVAALLVLLPNTSLYGQLFLFRPMVYAIVALIYLFYLYYVVERRIDDSRHEIHVAGAVTGALAMLAIRWAQL